jgi:phenylalanyl-tRNA synthetase beta chain
VGQAYASWAGLDDPLIEVSVTPNRGDALSVRGIARDLAASGLGTLLPLDTTPVAAAFSGGPRWQLEMPEACPWILGRTIRNLRNGPSPAWLRERLISVGLRPISALVDVTNLFTLDLGRPLHVFDAAKLHGDVLTLRPGRGETFQGLHGKPVTAAAEDCVIADADRAVSLAGVVGGEETGSDESTTTVFLECALFNPVTIALSGRRHQVNSDARARFERGIDPAFLPAGLEMATRLILELCGGEPGEVVAAGAEPAWRRAATLRFRRIAELGGAEIAPAEAVASLERLGFTVQAQDAERVTVSVPSWRNDIAAPIVLDPAPSVPDLLAAVAAIEPECDLIEEVLRMRGLDQVPAVSLPRAAAVPAPTLTPAQLRVAVLRRALAQRGMAECVTYSFADRAVMALFGAVPDSLHLLNPIASDLDQLRPTPLATLAEGAARNAARGWPDAALFEIGPGFRAEAPTAQVKIAAGLRAGLSPRAWNAPAKAADVFDAKADLWALLTAAAVPLDSLQITTDAPSHYHPGRSGTVRQGPKTVLGYFGALHPRVLERLGLPETAGFELILDAVQEPKRRRKAALDLPDLQPVRRDFAFVVDAAVAADVLLRAARGAERGLITQVALFDRYTGTGLPEGKVSLGIEVTLQPREKSLTDAEIEAVAQKIIAAVTKATGAALR